MRRSKVMPGMLWNSQQTQQCSIARAWDFEIDAPRRWRGASRAAS